MRFSPPKMDFSREEAAEREIGRTSVRPFVRRFLVAALLLTLVAVPAAQYVHEAVRTRQLKPRALKFLSAFPAAGPPGRSEPPRGAGSLLPSPAERVSRWP